MFHAAESLNDLNATDQFCDSEEVFVRLTELFREQRHLQNHHLFHR